MGETENIDDDLQYQKENIFVIIFRRRSFDTTKYSKKRYLNPRFFNLNLIKKYLRYYFRSYCNERKTLYQQT